MEQVSLHPLRILARIRAHMLTTRILVLGFVCIQWDWMAMLLTFLVWMIAEQMLTNSIYEHYTQAVVVKLEEINAQTHEETEEG
jgi:multisubunit Na+/H+ antiporter MnhG subunit